MNGARARVVFDGGDVRIGAALLLAGGAALQLVPEHASPACPVRALTGIPCPLCGMTTSVEATVRGDLTDAFAANPAGPPLLAAALVLLLVRTRRLALARWWLVAVVATVWAYELARVLYP